MREAHSGIRGGVMERDPRIDFVRGAGILMIAVDHLAYLAEKFGTPGFVNPFMTWMRFGWSSAAEFFVFFSGYLTGIVYLKTLEVHGTGMMCARAAYRSWHIYVVNLLTLCAVLLVLRMPAFASVQLNTLTDMNVLTGADAATGFAAFLQLRFAPLFFEILNLYAVLLLVAPAILLLARFSAITVVLLSFGVWLTVQLNATFGIAPAFGTAGNFNPLGWQFVFVLGMLGGVYNVFARLAEAFSRERLLIVTGALLAASLVIKTIDKSGWSLPLIGPIDMPGFDKVNLGALQLVHFLVSVVFVLQILPRGDVMHRALPLRAVAGVGRRSLECFCMSTILVYAAVGFMARTGSFDAMSLSIIGSVIVVLLCLLAPVIAWIEAQPWRSASRKRAPVPERLAPASTPLTVRDVP